MDDKAKIRETKEQIRRVFLIYWDPIGIADEPSAHDEYDSYLGGMYQLLTERASEQEIVDYLHEIETTRMGISPNIERQQQAARALCALSSSMGL